MYFWHIMAILLWLGGYFMTSRMMSNRENLSDNFGKIVAPPKWLYYLCGAPSNKEYPRGTMRVVALRSQITGIALMIFLVSSSLWKFSSTIYIIGLAVTLVASFTLTSYISKKYFLREQIQEPIKVKKWNSMTPTKITHDLSYSIEGDSINLYSEFGGKGGANLTIELDEIDALIEALQAIKAAMQTEQVGI